MSDYSELKLLLEYARDFQGNLEVSPDFDKFFRLEELTTPASLLALIAEVNSLRKDAGRWVFMREYGYANEVGVDHMMSLKYMSDKP